MKSRMKTDDGKKTIAEVQRHSLNLSKDELDRLNEYMKWTDELPKEVWRRTIYHYDVKLDTLRSIRIALVSRVDGFYIKPMLIEGADTLYLPNILETLPVRKEVLGSYIFNWDKSNSYHLDVTAE